MTWGRRFGSHSNKSQIKLRIVIAKVNTNTQSANLIGLKKKNKKPLKNNKQQNFGKVKSQKQSHL